MKRILLMAAMAVAPLVSAPIINLQPSSGNISGFAGETVGWGFNITNDTSKYLVVSSVTPSGFGGGLGTFTDFIASLNFYVVAPNSNLADPFNNATSQGFGSFAINVGALVGSSDSGSFSVTYDLYVIDPNIGGSDPGDEFGLTFDPLSASVSVVDTPEPGAGLLMAAGVVALAFLRRR